MCSEYNGWPNYETWSMNLWLTNDSSFYEVAEDAIEIIVNDDYAENEEGPTQIDKNDLVYKTQMWIEEYTQAMWLDQFESCQFNHSYGPIGDFVTSSWKTVNWYTIAEHIVTDWIDEHKGEVTDLEVTE
jgi:hypothetical protein